MSKFLHSSSWLVCLNHHKTVPISFRADCSFYRFFSTRGMMVLWKTHKSGMVCRVPQQPKDSQYGRNSLPEGQGSNYRGSCWIQNPTQTPPVLWLQRYKARLLKPFSLGLRVDVSSAPASETPLIFFKSWRLGSSKHAQALKPNTETEYGRKARQNRKLCFLEREKFKWNDFHQFKSAPCSSADRCEQIQGGNLCLPSIQR